MIAAIYARKSTDDSDRDVEARSCDRQIDSALKYAKDMGWTVPPEHIYRDDGVSGAEWQRRPGWLMLLAALEPRPPFSVLIVSELSRIGRDTVRTASAIQTLEEAGVEIHGYLTRRPISLADETSEVSTMMESWAAAKYRRETGRRAGDALLRRFEAGAATGTAAYGYRIARNGGGFAHYVVDETEAVIVRRIFTMYDEGLGLGRIAKTLYRDGVPSPRRGKGWSAGKLRLMLSRPTYVGLRSWRRTVTRWKGTERQVARPESEWLQRPCPELAVIEPDLWERVQARLRSRGETFLRTRGGHLIGRPRGLDLNIQPAHLMSGLLMCAHPKTDGSECGAALGPQGDRRRRQYGCASYRRLGSRACGNGLRVDAKTLEDAAIEALAKVLEPDAVEEATRLAAARVNARLTGATARRLAITAELAEVAKRERRLLDALVEGDSTAEVIRGRLRDELTRRDALGAELAGLDGVEPVDPEAAVQDLRKRAADLRALLLRHSTQARQVMRMVLGDGRFRCVPFDDTRGTGYEVSIKREYSAILGTKAAFTVRQLPWGWEMLWTLTPRYASKILYIRRGGEIELQYHRQIEESFFVRSGRLIFILVDADGELHEIWLGPGDSQLVPAGRRHRVIALEDSEVLEVSAPNPDLHSSAY